MSLGIHLKKVEKRYSDDQDKACHPKETITRVRENLKVIQKDILAQTIRIDSGRIGIPIFLSICGKDAIRTIGTQKQMGKGNTPEQSEASALMELVERYSFFSFLNLANYQICTYKELNDNTLPISELLFSIHDNKTDPKIARKILEVIPLRWVKAHNLTCRKDQYIPLDWFYLINEYNGAAAGNTLEEALLQALCEVIERHVGSVISHDRIITPTIDTSSVKYKTARELLGKFNKQGIRVLIKNFSLNTGVPTVGILAYDPATFPEKSEIIFTSGTTTNPEKSLCRALTEAAQLAGDFEKATTYKPTLPKYRSLDEANYLFKNNSEIDIHELPDLSSNNFLDEIYRCVDSLNNIDFDVIVLDITHRMLKIPSAYCIVPGAHFRERTRNVNFVFHLARVISQFLPARDVSKYLDYLDTKFHNRFDIQFFMGLSEERQGMIEQALCRYKRALSLNPDPLEVASIYVHIGSCYKDLEKYDTALSVLGQAQKHNPNLKEIYNLKGFCFYKKKEHWKAIEQFERAIEIDPGSAIDYANIGSNLRELGYLKEAVYLYQTALELDPQIEFARQNIVKLQAVIERKE